MVVNNNAAAVMLILSTLAQGGEVITSRGELVEIGGSFRVPDIMELCGCHLREVGTTNKTHLSDYERAIGEQTRALLKVHTSNYRIVGFTESLPLSDIVALGCRTGLPVVEDLGSGSLVDLEHYGIHDEPTVQNSIRAGVDVVSFSGDKLLGGPQAGIILGKKPYIDRMKRHPLARAIRVDKMTIAALWATLTTYQDLQGADLGPLARGHQLHRVTYGEVALDHGAGDHGAEAVLGEHPVHRQAEGDLLVADGHPAHPLLKLLFQFRDALTGISGHRQDRFAL